MTYSMDKTVKFTIRESLLRPMSLLNKAALELMAHVPREEVTHFWMHRRHIAMSDIYPQLPNLTTLHVSLLSLSDVPPGPDTIKRSAIPVSLKNLTLEWSRVDSSTHWSTLLNFLTHRASAGNPLHMLKIIHGPHMCVDIAGDIKRMVEVLEITDTDSFCPPGVCPDFDPDHPPVPGRIIPLPISSTHILLKVLVIFCSTIYISTRSLSSFLSFLVLKHNSTS